MSYYQNNYYPQFARLETPLRPSSRAGRPDSAVRQRMLFILAVVLFLVFPALMAIRPRSAGSADVAVSSSGASVSQSGTQETRLTGNNLTGVSAAGLSPVFTPEVRHWAPQIGAWAEAFGLDPNLVAIIMQIESCGDPQAVSGAGAQGLFQVMPFHFAPGENALEPETNARRGLAYFVERLAQTDGDVGRAFAGYNGGHVAAASGWSDWHPETQRYYVWSTGIYQDIQSGVQQSQTLQEWLHAGGASLCRQAAARLDM